MTSRRILRLLLLAATIADTGCTTQEMALLLSLIAPPPAPTAHAGSSAGAMRAAPPGGLGSFDPFAATAARAPLQLVSSGPVDQSPGFRPFSEGGGDFGPIGSGGVPGGGGGDFGGDLGPPGDIGPSSSGALQGGASFNNGM